MLHLMESDRRTRRHRPAPRWMAASGVVHVAVISAAALAGTREMVHQAVQPPADRIVYAAAPTPRTSTPDAARAVGSIMPGTVAIDLPSIPVPATGSVVTDVPMRPLAPVFDAPAAFGSAPRAAASAGDSVFGLHAVDRAVQPHSGNPQPEYPPMLRNAGTTGEVLVRFVVDTTGRVEHGSITIVEATHTLFGDAVRRWLARTRYVPAEIGGIPVRQLVERRVDFMLR